MQAWKKKTSVPLHYMFKLQRSERHAKTCAVAISFAAFGLHSKYVQQTLCIPGASLGQTTNASGTPQLLAEDSPRRVD